MPFPAPEKMLDKVRKKVRKFVLRPSLITAAEEAERVPGVPNAWVSVLRQQEQGINGWADLWQPYQSLLSDQDWELEPGEEASPPFRLDQVLTVFSNGGGDLRGLDFGSGAPETHALAWWHEELLAPEVNQNFWALLDGWICGQMENVDRQNNAA